MNDQSIERVRQLVLAYYRLRNYQSRTQLTRHLREVALKHHIDVAVSKQKTSSQLTGYRKISADDARLYAKTLGIPESSIGGAIVATRRLAPGVRVDTEKGMGTIIGGIDPGRCFVAVEQQVLIFRYGDLTPLDGTYLDDGGA